MAFLHTMNSLEGKISFRKAEDKDKKLIRQLAREAGSEEEEIDYFLQQDQLLVASQPKTKEFLGFIAYHTIENRLEISELGVREGSRRQKVGTKLLERVKETALTKNLDKVTVETSNDNIPALSLYQQFGFVIKEVKPGKLVEHHGKEEEGWHEIPVRDLFRLELEL